jgi:D-proline reductase (dithiol) PrdB
MSTQQPVAYMARTRAYYQAQGFERDYAYAHHDDAPFTPLPKPLGRCTLGLVTTASVYPRAPLDPRRVESAPLEVPPKRLYTDDLSWDKAATHTDDVASFCPIVPLRELVREGVIGALAPRFHCAPTEYSQRATVEHDAPEIARRLREDGADIALLVPL